MQRSQFEQMVARLEVQSVAAPGAYKFKVAALAALGFAILGLIVGVAGLGLLLLGGLMVAAVMSGGRSLMLLFQAGRAFVFLGIPMLLLVKASVSALLTRLPLPQGLEITRSQAPALFATLDTLRQRMKGPRFHHVLVNDDMGAAMLQRPLFGLIGWPRNYLILGLPLLEVVSADEAAAVVAHEVGHLAGSHSRFEAFIYRLRFTWAAVLNVSAQWKGFASKPLQWIVRWYAPYFNGYSFVLARANEYQADAASARLFGPDVVASALKRVNLAAGQYAQFMEQTFGTVRDTEVPPSDLALQWAGLAHREPAADQRRQWMSNALNRPPRLNDTHPTLLQRLRALPGQAERAEEPPPALAAPSAALAWFGDGIGALRESLQRQWRDGVREPWSEQHQAFRAKLQRLEALEARPAASIDDEIRRLGLRVVLFPDSNHVAALAAFNAAHANQPTTLFLEGCARLDHADDAGLQLLEHAMALDPDAAKAACERALAYLSPRGDARADAWAFRWKLRDEFETARARECAKLPADPVLRPADLTPEQRTHAIALLRRHGKGVKRAYLVRRVLTSDADAVTHVLGIELDFWHSGLGQGPAVVDRLAACDWPPNTLICVLEGTYRRLGKRIKSMPDSEVPFTR